MDIDFVAYSADSVISGRLTLGAERLTDLMTDASEYVVDDAAVEALDDRRVVSLAEVAVGRDELLLVVANGPRGNPGRRIRTRPLSIRVGVGPYELLGYAHAMPNSDPLASVKRRTIVPLTECRVRFERAGKPVEHWHDTVLVNSDKIDWLEIAASKELAPPPDLPAKIDPRARDMTGELLV